MPLPSDRPRLCVIGDSHLGSLRRAVDMGLVRFHGCHVEFWGAAGPQFRQIEMVRGVIRARGDAREMVRRVNGNGREAIHPGDFDCFLFYGARLRVGEFFGPYLHRQHSGAGWQSRAALGAAARVFLRSTRACRIAAELSRSGARVWFAPAPLPTAQVIDHTAAGRIFAAYPRAADATPGDRARLWDVLIAEAAAEGIELIRQPDDTVVEGILTDARFACDGAAESGDAGHKSPWFAAAMLGNLPLPVAARAA